MKKRIFIFHLLNDFSGSPKVLSQVIPHLVENGFEVNLVTSKSVGFLSSIEGIKVHNNLYKYKKNKLLRLFWLVFSQLYVLLKFSLILNKKDIVYVNTVLPFGGSIAGKVNRCKVIYHIHESTINPRLLKLFLLSTVKKTASSIINVSKYVQNQHQIKSIKNHLIYNALDEEFIQKSNQNSKIKENILMICSLKVYKGVFEFLKIAEWNPEENFQLVLNATQNDIDLFFQSISIPPNVSIFDAQKNVHPFYANAKIVLNLSRPDGWVETFGLTIIEAMAYKIPAIVPPVGGITEVISDHHSGFAVDSRNLKELQNKLTILLSDNNLYESFAKASHERLQLFSSKTFLSATLKVIYS